MLQTRETFKPIQKIINNGKEKLQENMKIEELSSLAVSPASCLNIYGFRSCGYLPDCLVNDRLTDKKYVSPYMLSSKIPLSPKPVTFDPVAMFYER